MKLSLFFRQSQLKLLLALAFFSGISFGATAAGVITFKTTLPVGAEIAIAISAEGDVTAEGLDQAPIADGEVHYYRLQETEVTLSGDIILLRIEEQGVETLDPRKASKLQHLFCKGNLLSELDLRMNEMLESVDCGNNQLAKLFLPKENSIKRLDVQGNILADLALYNCPILEELNYANNYYPTMIDLSACPEMRTLKVDGNKLRQIDVSHNPLLECLTCDQNELTSIDVSSLSHLRELSLGSNFSLSSITFGNHPELRKLDLFSTGITTLELGGYPQLEELYCGYCKLTSLDVSKNKKLKVLSCGKNDFQGIDVSQNSLLEELTCNDLQIETLNLEANPHLKRLRANHNSIEHIDLSRQEALEHLRLSNNRLRELDLSKQIRLQELYCTNNRLETLELPSGTDLTVVELYGNSLPSNAFESIVDRLPDRNGLERGLFKVVDTKDTSEKNDCLSVSVEKAVAKYWRVIDYADFANGGKGIDYRGSDAPLLGEGKVAMVFSESNLEVSLVVEALGELQSEGTTTPVLNQEEPQKVTLSGKELELQGDIYRFYLENAPLVSLSLDKCRYLCELGLKGVKMDELALPMLPNLEYLDIADNSLKRISIHDAPLLRFFICYGNTLDLDEGKELVQSLPTVNAGETAILLWLDSKKIAEENNALDRELWDLAKSKGWTLYDYAGGEFGEEGTPIPQPEARKTTTSKATLRIFPYEDWLHIEAAPEAEIYVYTLHGTILFSTRTDERGEADIPTSDLPSDMFILYSAGEAVKVCL